MKTRVRVDISTSGEKENKLINAMVTVTADNEYKAEKLFDMFAGLTVDCYNTMNLVVCGCPSSELNDKGQWEYTDYISCHGEFGSLSEQMQEVRDIFNIVKKEMEL